MNKSIFSIEFDGLIQYYIPADVGTTIRNDLLFDQYKIKALSIWCVILSINKLKWEQGVCNCPAVEKKIIYKHIVDIAIRLNLSRALPATKDVHIAEN